MLNKLKFAHKIIFVAGGLLAFALVSTTVINYLMLKQTTQQNLDSSISEITHSVSGNIANWLNGKLQIIEAVASAASKTSDKAQILAIVQLGDSAGDFKNAYVGLEAGDFILDDSAVQATLPAGFDPRGRPWYIQVKSSRQSSFTDPYIDVTINTHIISAVAPVQASGQFIGVAGGDILLGEIKNIINAIDFLGLGYGYLMTEKGNILSHPQAQFIDKNVSTIFGHIPARVSELQTVKIDGEAHLVSFVKIEGIASVNWYLGVVLNKKQAFASIATARNWSLLFGLFGLVFTVVCMQFLLRFLLRPVNQLSLAIQDISQGDGDLTKRLEGSSSDEIGLLSTDFNQFLDTIHRSITGVNQAAIQLKESIADVREVTDSSIEISEQQLGRVNNVTVAVSELGQSAQEITHNAANASTLTSSVQLKSEESLSALNDNIAAMDTLSDNMQISSGHMDKLSIETANIDNILEVIKGVSSQTNLLALNAAIEAARAGEMGRGFAVVADEVRQLAQRTHQSTQEIEVLIENLQQGAKAAVQTMEQSQGSSQSSVAMANNAGEKMQFILSSLSAIDSENVAVAQATKQQEKLINGIEEEMTLVNSLNDNREANLQHTITACDQLQQQFNQLDVLVSQFKV